MQPCLLAVAQAAKAASPKQHRNTTAPPASKRINKQVTGNQQPIVKQRIVKHTHTTTNKHDATIAVRVDTAQMTITINWSELRGQKASKSMARPSVETPKVNSFDTTKKTRYSLDSTISPVARWRGVN